VTYHQPMMMPSQDVETVRLQVPLFRQRFPPEAWLDDGFASSAEASLWSDRSCGIACVRMILAYCNRPVPSLAELLREGLALTAYSSRGWVHNGLAELLRRHGINAQAQGIDRDLSSLTHFLDEGRPLIASVTERFPCDGRTGGHLVIVTGYVRDGEGAEAVYFNDPSSWGQEHCTIPAERFLCSFTGRVIVPATSQKVGQ
jgi:hypothetical protein